MPSTTYVDVNAHGGPYPIVGRRAMMDLLFTVSESIKNK
jgi:hypothetical protein